MEQNHTRKLPPNGRQIIILFPRLLCMHVIHIWATWTTESTISYTTDQEQATWIAAGTKLRLFPRQIQLKKAQVKPELAVSVAHVYLVIKRHCITAKLSFKKASSPLIHIHAYYLTTLFLTAWLEVSPMETFQLHCCRTEDNTTSLSHNKKVIYCG